MRILDRQYRMIETERFCIHLPPAAKHKLSICMANALRVSAESGACAEYMDKLDDRQFRKKF
jgi:hypothetical protein